MASSTLQLFSSDFFASEATFGQKTPGTLPDLRAAAQKWATGPPSKTFKPSMTNQSVENVEKLFFCRTLT